MWAESRGRFSLACVQSRQEPNSRPVKLLDWFILVHQFSNPPNEFPRGSLTLTTPVSVILLRKDFFSFQVIEIRRMEAALAKGQEPKPTSKQNFRQKRNVIVVSP